MIKVDPNLEAETFVGEFRQCVMRGGAINRDAPTLFMIILKNGYWKRPDKNGKPFKYVEQFIKAAPLPGLGSDIDSVKRIIRDDPSALDALDQALQETERRGRPEESVNNVNELQDRPQGNSRQRSIRTLREKRPDLLRKVKAGSLSAHAAMIEAGLREKTITIPDDPEKAARRIRRHFEGDRLQALIKYLNGVD